MIVQNLLLISCQELFRRSESGEYSRCGSLSSGRCESSIAVGKRSYNNGPCYRTGRWSGYMSMTHYGYKPDSDFIVQRIVPQGSIMAELFADVCNQDMVAYCIMQDYEQEN